MKRVHIIGGKNHGKTTLVVELVREFRRLGIRVGTIKHTHHQHELDTPGKDSHRHRDAGAAVTAILSPTVNAVFWAPTETSDAASRDKRFGSKTEELAAERKYAAFKPLFDSCQIVLVEGDSQTRAVKCEVWRCENGTRPLAASDASIVAVITDDALRDVLDTEIWPRSDVVRIAQNLLSLKIES